MPTKTKTQPRTHLLSRERIFYLMSSLILVLAAILIIIVVVNNILAQRQQASLHDQNKKTTQLIEQVKALSEQNKVLSQETANYAYCNALLFATYTQNLQPIAIEDLNKCITKSFPKDGTTTQLQIQTSTEI